jgi:hypothetical protein
MKIYFDPILNKLRVKDSTNGSGSNITGTVNNFSSLPPVALAINKFYWVSNSQGTSWLPFSLGGTFYNSGLYYSNGVTWEFMNVPFQATQNEVNLGVDNEKFVTPLTLKNNVDTAVGAKEDSANKATTMTGNTTSNIVFLTAKAIYDWATGLFTPLTRTLTINGTTQDLSANRTFNVGTILGTLPATSGQLTYSNGTLNTLTSSSSLTFNGTSLNVGNATPLVTQDFNVAKSLAGVGAAVGFSITNTNSTGVVANDFGESLSNRLSIGKYGSTSSQAVNGTSLNYQNTSVVISTSGGNFGGGNLYIQGSPIINIIGATSTNIGSRLDAVGLRIDAINTLHTANNYLFQIKQSLFLSGNTLSLASNKQYQSNATGTGNSRTWRWFNDAITAGDFVFQQSTNNANMTGVSWSNRFWLYFNPNGLIGIGDMTSPTANLHIASGTTTNAQLRLESGVAPTSPNNGDIWFDNVNLYMRIAGVTKTFILT